MNLLISFCLKNRITVILLTLALSVISLFVVKNIPVDVFPELWVPRVTVQTEAPGLTAEEVEQYVTIPIESAMNGTAGVKGVRTSSGAGLSFVWVDFEWDTDIYQARQIVSERLTTVRESLPDNVSTEMAPIVSVTGEIMLIAITGDKNTDLLEMRQLAQYKLRNRLLAIPGVGQVTVLGGRLPEYQVIYDPNRLKVAGADIADLKEAIVEAQSSVSAGYLEDVAGQELPIQQDTRAMSPEQLKRTLVPGHPGGILRLEDVTEVKIDGAPRRGDAAYMGEDAVILSVQKIPGANTMKLTAAVDAAVKEFSQSQLPEGMRLHTSAYRQSDFIEMSLNNGSETLIETGIVVMLVVVLSLLNVRTAVITLISMPLSVLFGMMLFPMFGLAINIMTLGGMAVAVGDVVDNAIIFVEIAWRHLNRNAALPEGQRKSRFRVLMDSKDEIVGAITFSSIIVLLVFTPVIFLSGLEGQFFRPLAISYMVALAASLFVAVTITPVLCFMWFKKSKNAATQESGDSYTSRLIKRIYAPILAFCMRFSKTVCAIMAGITLLALWLGSTFGASFLPPFNEDCYTVFINTVPGTSLDETDRITRSVMKDVERIPGVLSVTQRTGRAENDEHAEPVSASEMVVRVDLNRDQKEIRAAIKKCIDDIPGTTNMIGYPLAHRISAALSGSNSDIAINIYGTDLAQLREAAAKAKEILASMPEVADARANREIMVDTIRVQYDQEALSAYGITMANAAEQVSTAMNGQKLGEVIKNQEHWDIMLRIDPKLRSSMQDVKNLELISPNGKTVRLGDVAQVYREETTNLILRDNTMRKAMISCNPAPDSNLGDLAKACREKLDPVMNAMGCTVDYAGTIKARESASERLYALGAIVLVLIILFLAASLGSMRRAMITLVNIPLCLVGGILAIFLASPDTVRSVLNGETYVPPIISVASIVGFVTVIGFAIRSGLILLNRYRTLEQQGVSPEDAIRIGSQERVVPIIMTSLTTILGLLPLIFAIDDPGGELLGPLAIVQFGGLFSATILNLIIIPATSKIFSKWLVSHRKSLEETV